ncbi:MAG: ABC transporter ATP-binding protein [Alphaproteobacteria bacterium]|nr:ABC transporter ATP-binding protein [Alphaproteobacteria bacterium]
MLDAVNDKNMVFKTDAITKQYGMGDLTVHALRGVTLEVPRGELVVLLGPSGSGKSTFLNIIGGLDQPTSGDVHFEGHALADMTDRELTYFRREHVGFVFQSYNLVPSLTALENVELITDIAENPMPAKEALEIVKLKDRLNHFPSQLSGGEQQRVAIARAIAKRPEVMLCDEPTGALDSETGILVLEALQNVNHTYGTTTIIITHNAAIANVADRVIYFADGQVAKVVKNDHPKDIHEIGW